MYLKEWFKIYIACMAPRGTNAPVAMETEQKAPLHTKHNSIRANTYFVALPDFQVYTSTHDSIKVESLFYFLQIRCYRSGKWFPVQELTPSSFARTDIYK